MKNFLILAMVTSFFLPLGRAPCALKGRVLRVKDGDTVVFENRPTRSRVVMRLLYIDALEKQQTDFTGRLLGRMGQEGLQRLTKGKELTAICLGQDIYGRELCELFDRGQSVNLAMVKAGLSPLYDRSEYPDRHKKALYFQAFAQAYREGRGVFQSEKFLSAKTYRKRRNLKGPAEVLK